MGCTSSIPISCIVGRRRRKKPSSIHEVAVFVPALRIPLAVDLVRPLRGLVSRDVLDKLSTLRGRIVSLAEESYLAAVPTVSELERALEEYVPVLLGLTKKGMIFHTHLFFFLLIYGFKMVFSNWYSLEHRLEASVEFKWKSLGDDDQETCFASAWYELLSVVHMMAMLSLLEANLMLVPKDSMDECGKVVSEDAKKVAVDLLLKAAGCLDYCVRHILVQLPMQIRKSLPSSLQEGMLEAISVQALAQSVEMQLGLALECEKATLSVKRRLACEAVSYFSQVHYCMAGCDTSDAYGKKLLLFIKWKYLEAKAAAYYYHGLVLDKGNGSSNHLNAVCCLFVAEELLTDSKRACLSFCLAAPVTRVPPAWGVMKHLRKKIPEVASKKSQMYGYPIEQDKNGAFQSLPDLPEFPLSLKPDDYELPNIDPSWESKDCQPQIQSLKAHLKDEEDDEMGTE
ncbi:uncharacterized protein LOC103708086 isoform X1 [Phoenix dactylifera]|uniref:Uncharacterized protein LOC103708086 isoform X1 n=1 Tax=Phoenix dactylifera TaxID=42345 RepID=A0A8B9ASC5_PHODC|nr:uncharacterized protein LOC103708086 isoform X1 [Phoenix dactylifera]